MSQLKLTVDEADRIARLISRCLQKSLVREAVPPHIQQIGSLHVRRWRFPPKPKRKAPA